MKSGIYSSELSEKVKWIENEKVHLNDEMDLVNVLDNINKLKHEVKCLSLLNTGVYENLSI